MRPAILLLLCISLFIWIPGCSSKTDENTSSQSNTEATDDGASASSSQTGADDGDAGETANDANAANTDDGEGAGTDDASSDGPDDDAESTGATDSDDDTQQSTAFDSYSLVPAEKHEGDLSKCPAGFEAGPLTAGQHEEFLSSGEARNFFIGLPDPALFQGPRPMLILFNGTGGTGQGAFDAYGGATWTEHGFIVLAPSSAGHGIIWPSWFSMLPAGDVDGENVDLTYFDELLACSSAHLEVDKNRLYIAGHSAGGIMSNFVLRRRSELLAGAVVASGIFDLTEPRPMVPLDDMVIMVTWGGDNDSYSGDSENEDIAVPEVNFVEQASIASSFYEAQEGMHQLHCRGNDLGHKWLAGALDIMVDLFMNHPKGLAIHDNWSLDALAPPSDSVCSEDAYEFVLPTVVECAPTEPATCHTFCQFFGDCLVENGTVAPVLTPALLEMGFAGDDLTDCDGCLQFCTDIMDGAEAVDDTVAACFEAKAATAECTSGITGALPAIQGVNECCVDAPDSNFCAQICGSLVSISVAISFVEDGCIHWIPEEEPAEEDEGSPNPSDG